MTIDNKENKKTDCYLIDNEVLFFPANSILRHKEKGEEVTLFSTASRCLELLIQKHGSTLSQKELIDAAWIGQGHNVTQNTFYQNISNLRKAFNLLLPEKQIIVTIKRVGLLIPEEISITPIDTEAAGNPPVLVISEVNNVILEDAVNPTIVADPRSIPLASKIAINTPYSLFSRMSIGLFLLSAIALVSSIYFYYAKGQEKSVFPFINYVVYKKFINSCTVMVNPDAGRIDPMNRYLNRSPDCWGYEKIYVTLWEQRMTTSALYCSPTRDGIGYSCVSEYLSRGKSEIKSVYST